MAPESTTQELGSDEPKAPETQETKEHSIVISTTNIIFMEGEKKTNMDAANLARKAERETKNGWL